MSAPASSAPDRPALSAIAAGLLAAFVGFASSFPIVIKGLTAMGASPVQAASGLMALSFTMGACAIWFSLRRRMPISIAWSTPGAALLAASTMPEGGFPVAVGAFLLCGALVVLAGWWSTLGRWVSAIPAPVANAMLAGVLLNFCLAPIRAIGQMPVAGLAIVLTWAIMGRIQKLLAVPAAVAVAIGAVILTTPDLHIPTEAWIPRPELVMPDLTLGAVLGLALPLFIVTMVSQNIPGMAVLAVNGYQPALGPLLRGTGLFSLAAAPFGGHVINLAAITAALCANDDVHPDPARRYWAAVIAGIAYLLLALLSGAAMAFIGAAPPVLIEAVAGLALIGSFGGAMFGALSAPDHREAALVTFLVTASGLSAFGVSGAFWGLIAGGAMLLLGRWRR